MNCLLKNLAKKLINQPSISPKDHGCQDIILHYLQKLNFYVELMHFDDTLNLWAHHNNCRFHHKPKKQQHTLLFLGHTDVVPPGDLQLWNYPPFSGVIHDNTLYGRGASDMKGALAAMLIATKNFINQYPNHQERIAFLITSDEEGNGINGTVKVIESLMMRHEHIDYCIVGEPSSRNQLGDVIKNGRRGSLTGKLIIYGSPGHVAYSQFSQNPIHLAIPALFDILNTKWDQKVNVLFPSTSMQITNINTNNNNNNIIPNQVILDCNFRFNNQLSVNNIQKHMDKICTYYKLNYHIDWNLSAEPYFSKPRKLTKIAVDVIKHYQKITPQLETTGGTSDGRFIHKIGSEVEIIELGALNCTIHKANECINLADLQLLSEIYQKIIEKILLNI